jgi:hypothetical protein
LQNLVEGFVDFPPTRLSCSLCLRARGYDRRHTDHWPTSIHRWCGQQWRPQNTAASRASPKTGLVPSL